MKDIEVIKIKGYWHSTRDNEPAGQQWEHSQHNMLQMISSERLYKNLKKEKDEKEYGEVKYCFKVFNALLELTDAA